MAGGAPKGNHNAAKGRMWFEALHKTLAQDKTALPAIAKAVVEAAKAGEPWAVTEVGNRLDGKPVQQVNVDANVNQPQTLTNAYLAFVAAGGNPDEYNSQTEH